MEYMVGSKVNAEFRVQEDIVKILDYAAEK